MEIGSFKIDLNGLALLVTAITGAIATWRGLSAKKRKEKDKEKHGAIHENDKRDD